VASLGTGVARLVVHGARAGGRGKRRPQGADLWPPCRRPAGRGVAARGGGGGPARGGRRRRRGRAAAVEGGGAHAEGDEGERGNGVIRGLASCHRSLPSYQARVGGS
jgi:hypothetical protein